MAMSDCIKCWDTPCTCGYEYRNYSREKRLELAATAFGLKPEDTVALAATILNMPQPELLERISTYIDSKNQGAEK